VAQKRERCGVRRIDDDAGDDQAEEYDHQYVGNVTEQLSASKIVAGDNWGETRALNLAAHPSARVDVHGTLTAKKQTDCGSARE
jgi:hypothetical protein